MIGQEQDLVWHKCPTCKLWVDGGEWEVDVAIKVHMKRCALQQPDILRPG